VCRLSRIITMNSKYYFTKNSFCILFSANEEEEIISLHSRESCVSVRINNGCIYVETSLWIWMTWKRFFLCARAIDTVFISYRRARAFACGCKGFIYLAFAFTHSYPQPTWSEALRHATSKNECLVWPLWNNPLRTVDIRLISMKWSQEISRDLKVILNTIRLA
jgi:hypothetical protein